MAFIDSYGNWFNTSAGLPPRAGESITIQTPYGLKKGWFDGYNART